MAALEAVGVPRPQPPRVSLLQAAIVETANKGGGVTYRPASCSTGAAEPTCVSVSYTIDDNEAPVEYEFFEVWTGFKCSLMGRDDSDPGSYYLQQARDALTAVESHFIEREFWRGDVAAEADNDNNYLAHITNSDRISDEAETPSDALALLEDALASCNRGQRGMIHAPSSVVTKWAEGGALRREGAYILTVRDTIIVPGSGYDGTGPGGLAALDSAVHAYATGMVRVFLSDVETTPSTAELVQMSDRGANTAEARAFRYAAVTFDPCCQFAVAVDAPVPAVGGAS